MLLAEGFGQFKVTLAEFLVHAEVGLAHTAKNRGRTMLGRDLELTADVVAYKLLEKALIGICKQIVEADARADKYLLYPRQRLDSFDKLDVFGVICHEVLAGRGREALARRADSVAELLFAGGVAEVRRRSADVVDIALEIGHLGDLLCLLKHALDASRAHGAPLVERERAEIARAEATAIVSQREAHLLDRGHAAILFVDGVVCAHIGKGVNSVKLLALKRRHRGILNE